MSRVPPTLLVVEPVTMIVVVDSSGQGASSGGLYSSSEHSVVRPQVIFEGWPKSCTLGTMGRTDKATPRAIAVGVTFEVFFLGMIGHLPERPPILRGPVQAAVTAAASCLATTAPCRAAGSAPRTKAAPEPPALCTA